MPLQGYPIHATQGLEPASAARLIGLWTGRRQGAYALRVFNEVAGRRAMRAAVTIVLLALVLPMAGSLDAVAAPRVENDKDPLVLYHWWATSSEMAALNALASVFKTKYPGVAEKRTVAPDRGDRLFAILENLIRAGKPPDAIVMQTGYAMRPFINAGLLSPIDDLWVAEGLEKVVPPTLQAMHKFDGHYYSIPLDVQRTNLIWYNKRVLDKCGIDPDTLTTWERFFDAATRLRAAGISSPIQIAASWTVAETFGNIMASLGLAAYQDWVNGKIRAAADPRMVRALGILKSYSTYVNRDHADLDWTVALGRVARGESAFYAMGDWANGDFRAAGLVYGKDYGAIVVPGTKGLYGVTIDAFVQPRGIARPSNSNRWLRTAASREGQDAFNVPKGAIPARTDAEITRYDAYQRWAIASFKRAQIYPSYGAALPQLYVRGIEPALEALVGDGDVRKAGEALSAATTHSAGSFTRVWSLD
jgi:glucose/mannose transport system substrate-binding protein